MEKIAFYISNHGFGHMARNIPIIQKVLEIESSAIVYLVCDTPHLNFAMQSLKQFEDRILLRSVKTDVGLILKENSLFIDLENLKSAVLEYTASIPKRSTFEAAWMIENGITKAVCDMPVWVIPAAKTAGVPVIFTSNFTWVEIYREHMSAEYWEPYLDAVRQADHALLLGLHNDDMTSYFTSWEPVSITCREFHAQTARKIRARHHRPIVFLSLGMSADFTEPVNVDDLPYDFYTTGGIPVFGKNVTMLPRDIENTQDYILASDYVIIKAGWGTVAEALLAQKPMALFSRDTVFEDRTTIQKLEALQLAAKIQQSDLNDIAGIIKKLDALSCRNFGLFYNSASEQARKILSFQNTK